jgi:hypothetical protein
MKTPIALFLLCPVLVCAGDFPQFLGPVPKELRAPVESVPRQTLLNATNVQRTIVLPSLHWQTSGGGPGTLIAEFKRAFESSKIVATPTKEQDAELREIPFRESISWNAYATSPDKVRWSDVYFLTRDGGFLSFGEIKGGFIFFTDKTAGVILVPGAEPGSPANRSQPAGPGTNKTPAAAGSGR